MMFYGLLFAFCFHITHQASIRLDATKPTGRPYKSFGFALTSLNHIFTEIQLESIPDQRSISAEVVQVLIHGHSLYDEAAFYELYMIGAIDSRKSLNNFIGTRIPGFKGVTEKEFDAIMSKWLYHLLSRF